MQLRAWLRAARPLAHGNIAPPILLGEAMACDGAALDLTLFVCAHLFGVLDHLAIVFANDFADEETDRKNANATPFSGGSRVLVRGELEARDLGRAALVMSAALLASSCLVALLFARPHLPLFALTALALLHAYSFAPLRLSYRGGGELLQGIGIGVVLPALGYYMQRGSLEGLSGWALLALFVFGVAGNLLTALPDTASDRASLKHTWSVLFGELHARVSALVMTAFGLVLLASCLHQRALETTLVMIIPLLAMTLALRWLADGNASNRRALLAFLVSAAGAMTFAELGWSIALFMR
jgi:1,4-dihydroxy-2-naphthoate octaprenyltransferase